MIESILYKTALYCRLSLDDGSFRELSIGVPFLDIEIVIPLDSHIALYSKDVYWKPWSL
jgi:hypothetical protein